MDIVKAEVLWTRKCPLRCGYCGMPSNLKRAPVDLMCEGVDRLVDMGCKLLVIYGASPFYDPEDLDVYIRHATNRGLYTTVIVDGVVVDSDEIFDRLYKEGLRSLTVSCDLGAEGVDRSVQMKAWQGLHLLRKVFDRYKDLRDCEICSTVTRRNIHLYLEDLGSLLTPGGESHVISRWMRKGVWFSFDVVHPDRGQPGSKCRGGAEAFRFGVEDRDLMLLRGFASLLIQLKERGYPVHQSEKFLQWVVSNTEDYVTFRWNCGYEDVFPSWLTIDADGTVRPCDDFCTPGEELKVWEIDEGKIKRWVERQSEGIRSLCPGCSWSTHIDAMFVKRGEVEVDHYVHLQLPDIERS